MSNKQSRYAEAGVDIDAGQRAVNLMKDAVKATYTDNVLSDTGNFGGLFAVDALKHMQAPVLVASTDGVGTKTMVAAALDTWDTIGQDLVNHCINDILVQGARPLFFLDYVASSQLAPEQIAAIVTGMAKACQEAGCALLGGETAEMPGVYAPNEVDVVGTIVGMLDKPNLLDGTRISASDVIFGLPSSGLHTNGFTLARMALAEQDWTSEHPALGMTIGEALLAVHKNYVADVDKLNDAGVDVRGLAHITGGGMVENLPRILPDGVEAVIERGSWAIPPIFGLIQTLGNISRDEMLRVFNMGVGMIVIVPESDAGTLSSTLPEAYRIGQIVASENEDEGTVRFEG
ncbi:MAG: phosphoribosylformylglycinamidine cyclo-ligase [Chloroflexota bacterium]